MVNIIDTSRKRILLAFGVFAVILFKESLHINRYLKSIDLHTRHDGIN